MEKKDFDSGFSVKLTFSEFNDLQDELVMTGALLERMNKIHEKVGKNFEKMWEICSNAYLKDYNDGKK